MNTVKMILMVIVGLLSAGPALAAEAESSAHAGSAGRGGSFAEAGARYDGDVGFAQTRTHSGQVSLARGLAVGLDANGLSLSASHAVALPAGLAVARNFNLTLGRDGRVAVSSGHALSLGAQQRSAGVSGRSGIRAGRPLATSSAFGRSDRRGVVKTRTQARSSPPRVFPRRRFGPRRF